MLIELLTAEDMSDSYDALVLGLANAAENIDCVSGLRNVAVVEYKVDMRHPLEDLSGPVRDVAAVMKLAEQVPVLREMFHQNSHYVEAAVTAGDCHVAEQLVAGVFSMAFVMAWDLRGRHGRGLEYLGRLEAEMREPPKQDPEG